MLKVVLFCPHGVGDTSTLKLKISKTPIDSKLLFRSEIWQEQFLNSHAGKTRLRRVQPYWLPDECRFAAVQLSLAAARDSLWAGLKFLFGKDLLTAPSLKSLCDWNYPPKLSKINMSPEKGPFKSKIVLQHLPTNIFRGIYIRWFSGAHLSQCCSFGTKLKRCGVPCFLVIPNVFQTCWSTVIFPQARGLQNDMTLFVPPFQHMILGVAPSRDASGKWRFRSESP